VGFFLPSGVCDHCNSARPSGKQQYVVGFNFIRGPEFNAPWRVVLIQKMRPDWQRLKLNGVGGHVEPGESPMEAMKREYREETGESLNVWTHFLTLEFPDAVVHFFKSVNMWTNARTVTDEDIVIVNLTDDFSCRQTYLANLCWLLPMALHSDDGGVLQYKSCATNT
jgi:8-oxo-dGTP diphosphatase